MGEGAGGGAETGTRLKVVIRSAIAAKAGPKTDRAAARCAGSAPREATTPIPLACGSATSNRHWASSVCHLISSTLWAASSRKADVERVRFAIAANRTRCKTQLERLWVVVRLMNIHNLGFVQTAG